MKRVELTIEEIRQATRPMIQESKKRYSRKNKHKKRFNED